jgi:hypothetical protein
MSIGKLHERLSAPHEAGMSAVSLTLALPVVLLFVAMLAYLVARAFLLIGPPGAHRHRPPRGRHP